MDPETFNQVLDLIQMLAIIVGMILLHNSIPADKIDKLFDRLEANAKKTATSVDDTMISFGRLLSTLFTGQIPGQPAPAGAAPVSTDAQPVPIAVTGVVTASPAPVATSNEPTQLADNTAAG